MMEYLQCQYESDPVCPYCGYVIMDAYEYEMGDGDTRELECYSCGKEFTVSCSVDVNYSTTPKEGWDKDVL